MPQHYSDPARESDPYALPNIEIFHARHGELSDGSGAGWYYWYCFPGCLPDGEPEGPYETEAEALAACRDQDTDPNDVYSDAY